jgi:hypothetical protein
VFADRNFGFHTRRHVVADTLDDSSSKPTAVERVIGNFHHHDHAVTGFTLVIVVHHHIEAEAGIIRHHESDTAFLHETSHDVTWPLLHQGYDGALVTAPAVNVLHPRQHLVAVENALHFPRREIDIRPFTGAGYETEPIPMANDPSGYHVHAIRQRESIASISHDGACLDQRVEMIKHQLGARLSGNAEGVTDTRERHGFPGFTEDAEYIFS